MNKEVANVEEAVADVEDGAKIGGIYPISTVNFIQQFTG